jgi:N-acetylglucosaminyldiphosphoundecaprenol N-acetyl-beta-D-mannosaminyltransferase
MNTQTLFATVSVFGLPFVQGSVAEVGEKLTHLLSSEKLTLPLVIFTPNPEQIVFAHHEPQFRSALEAGDLLLPDGQGIIWAAQGKLKQRIPGIDCVSYLLQAVPTTKKLVLGGQHYPAQEGKLVQWPETYWNPGYQDISAPTPEEEKAVLAMIKTLKPEVIFVAFGAPYQEYWAVTHREFLQEQGVKVIMVVGGTFDVLTGKLRRSPAWVRSIGFEWLFRLLQQPWRWQRQLKLLEFVGMTLKGKKQETRKS